MKIILKETIGRLGVVGSEVEVANGYARNYLLPQKKAVLATLGNRNAFKMTKVKLDLRIAKERELAEEMAKRLASVECTIAGKVNERSELYGSISASDITEALAAKDIKIEKQMLVLKKPIKHIGVYKIPVRIYADIEVEITVLVVSE